MSQTIIQDPERPAYLVWNPDQQKTIVCLHGYADLPVLFAPLRDLLPDRRVIAIDLCACPDQPRASLAQLTDYVCSVIRSLGLVDYELAGFSFGGLVAISVAGREQNNIRRLVVLNSFPCLWRGALRRQLLRAIRPVLTLRPCLFVISRISAQPWVRSLLGAPYANDMKRQHTKDQYESVYGTMIRNIDCDLTDVYSSLPIPKHLILCKDDELILWKPLIPLIGHLNSECTLFETGGHASGKTYWPQVADVLSA